MLDASAANLVSGPNAELARLARSTGGDPAKIDAAAEDFEAVMLTALLKPVFDSIQSSEPFGGGEAENTWRGMLVEEYTKEMAANGGIGIADQVRAALLRLQEVQP